MQQKLGTPFISVAAGQTYIPRDQVNQASREIVMMADMAGKVWFKIKQSVIWLLTLRRGKTSS